MIDIKNLNFSYPGNVVLKDVNLKVEKGEFVAVIGSNGAGKSTLLKLLLSELQASSGDIVLFGKKVDKDLKNNKIGYVPQTGLGKNSLFPASVQEVVSTSLYSSLKGFKFLGSKEKAKINEALKMVGMHDYSTRLISQLSGGQRQRVLLARALAADPELLILDEPTTGIDSETCQDFYKLLKRLNEEKNLTILTITHDLRGIYPFISSTYCLEEGYLLKLTDEQINIELSHKHKHPPLERS